MDESLANTARGAGRPREPLWTHCGLAASRAVGESLPRAGGCVGHCGGCTSHRTRSGPGASPTQATDTQ